MPMKMAEKEIEITADGSATVYLPAIDEHYHSVKGALTESLHVFRDCGLRHHPGIDVRVLEVGLGTGLNAAITACDTTKKHIAYYAVELYPLQADEAAAVAAGYAEYEAMLHSIHLAPWNCDVELSARFTLHKMLGDFTSSALILPEDIDVCYMDAFSPDKQPEMWSVESMSRLYGCMSEGGVLTTYCAKGEVRRRLSAIGFDVERLAGPPGGKREILRAIKR